MCKLVIVAMLHQEWKSMAAAHGSCCSNEQWNNCCVCVCERAQNQIPFIKSPVKTVSMMGFSLWTFCNTICIHFLPCISPPKFALLIANGNETDLNCETVSHSCRFVAWPFNLWKQKCSDCLRYFQDPLGGLALLLKIWVSWCPRGTCQPYLMLHI